MVSTKQNYHFESVFAVRSTEAMMPRCRDSGFCSKRRTLVGIPIRELWVVSVFGFEA